MLRPRGVEGFDANDLEIPVTDHLGAKIGTEVRELSTRTHCAVLNIVMTRSVTSTASSAYTRPDWNLLKMRV